MAADTVRHVGQKARRAAFSPTRAAMAIHAPRNGSAHRSDCSEAACFAKATYAVPSTAPPSSAQTHKNARRAPSPARSGLFLRIWLHPFFLFPHWTRVGPLQLRCVRARPAAAHGHSALAEGAPPPLHSPRLVRRRPPCRRFMPVQSPRGRFLASSSAVSFRVVPATDPAGPQRSGDARPQARRRRVARSAVRRGAPGPRRLFCIPASRQDAFPVRSRRASGAPCRPPNY